MADTQTKIARQEGFLVARLVLTARNSIAQVADNFGNGKTGGYLCVANNNRLVIGCNLVGTILPAESATYINYSTEKARRLGNHRHTAHLSSWESRDVAQHKYGGAVRAGNYILSFSGLSEKVGEAFVVGLVRLSWIDTMSIGLISQNTLITPVFCVMQDALKAA